MPIERTKNLCDAAREAYEKKLKQDKIDRQKALVKIVGKEFAAQCVWIESEQIYHICGHDYQFLYDPDKKPCLFCRKKAARVIYTLADLGAELAYFDDLKKRADAYAARPFKPSLWQRVKNFFN